MFAAAISAVPPEPVNGSAFDGAIWLLLDEPERGLHRTAEAHMARGVTRLAQSGVISLLATHSPELLDRSVGEVNFVRRRSETSLGSVLRMSEFEPLRSSLGLNSSDLLRRTRGFALVEGEHDREVLRGMVGHDLAQLGIEILAVRGSSRLKTTIDSQFLYQFTDALLFPILDGIRLDRLREIWNHHIREARLKGPAEVANSLIHQLRDQFGQSGRHLGEFLVPSLRNGTFNRVMPPGIPQRDVLECLPVTELIPGASSWQEVRDAGTKKNRGVEQDETMFKAYPKTLGADLSEPNIHRIAQRSTHSDIEALAAAMAESIHA